MKEAIVILKLKGGMEVVGSLVVDQPKSFESIVLRTPLQIIYKMIPGYSFPLISLKHYMIFAEDNAKISFRKVDIANIVRARPAFVKFYRVSVNKKEILDDVDYQLDTLSFYDTPEHERTKEDKEKKKQSGYRQILENFDRTGRKPN